MLYMFISTWHPDKGEEVFKRFQEWGSWAPKGMREIGVWVDVWRNRSFRLCEISEHDAVVMGASTLPWNDIVEITEAAQVIDGKEVVGLMGEAMKLLPEKKQQ